MHRTILVVSTVILVLGWGVAYRAQQPAPDPARLRAQEELPGRDPGLPEWRPQWEPDQDPENWRPLGPDLGIRLYRDSFGSPRGRVYVQREGHWVAVAVDGLSDIGAPTLPAR